VFPESKVASSYLVYGCSGIEQMIALIMLVNGNSAD